MKLPEPKNLKTARAVIATLVEQLDRQQREIELLKQKLDQLCRRMFGSKSEKVDPRQLSLLLGSLGVAVEKPLEDDACEIPRVVRTRRPSGGRRPLPKNLPRRRTVIDPPEEEKVCGGCGKAKVLIGSKLTEKLDYVPASFWIEETERRCFACPECQEGVVAGDSPVQAVEKGLAAAGLLAQVVVAKYADHLPLNRQERIYARHGVDLSRSTLCDFVAEAAKALEPIRAELKRQVLSSDYIQTDDTSVTVLAETRGTFKGRVWTYLDPLAKQVVFDATPTHERDGPEAFLGGFRGHLQADAYAGYDALFRSGRIVEVACWAHARRRFVEALPSDARAATIVSLIQRLYEVERDAKGLDPGARQALRRDRSAPLLDELDQERKRLGTEVLPKSALGEALGYLNNQWDALQRFLEDGRLRVDNNGAEYQLRAVAVGRKNWMFAGSMNGAHRAALLYSLVQSCRLVGIDPFAYLRDVLIRVATHPQSRIAELTPKGWAAAFGNAATPQN
jgi:transposase